MEDKDELIKRVLARVSELSDDLNNEMGKSSELNERVSQAITILGANALELAGNEMGRQNELSLELARQLSSAVSLADAYVVLTGETSKELSEIVARVGVLWSRYSEDLSEASAASSELSMVASRIGMLSTDLSRELSEIIELSGKS